MNNGSAGGVFIAATFTLDDRFAIHPCDLSGFGVFVDRFFVTKRRPLEVFAIRAAEFMPLDGRGVFGFAYADGHRLFATLADVALPETVVDLRRLFLGFFLGHSFFD